MADIELKVSTEQLVSAADQLALENKKLKQQFDLWNQKMRKLCDQWQGDGSTQGLQGAKRMTKNSETMITIIEEYIQKFKDLSGVYAQSEQQAKQKNQALPVGDVFR